VGAAGELSRSARSWSAANPGNRAAREELIAAIRRAVAPQLLADGDLLDCGCGTGWLLEALALGGVAPDRLYGVDVDRARVEAASRRVPGASAIVADARDLPFADRTFDVVFHIVALSSIGPAQSVRAALAESRRVLAPRGVLVVYEPRLPNPFNRATRLLRSADLEAAGLPVSEALSLTLLPQVGRRLGRLTPALRRSLSALPPLRSHRLLVHRAAVDGRPEAARTRGQPPTR
jgi:ubiquinone/menaquinone biosynthesis C-methylase UbiE